MNRSPAPASARRPRRTAGLLLRAVGALVALVLTVGGLPWLLWQASVALAPGGWDGLQHLFTRQDTGSVALLAVCLIGWLAWASFILSLLLEIPAQLRGVRAPRLPGIQVSQRAAAALVGSLLVLLPTGTALAASPAEAAPRAETAVTAAAQPGADVRATSHTETATAGDAVRQASSSVQDTYTVRGTRPAESLWSIAERLYGTGEAYTHIAQANEGQRMVDGQTFHADAPIQPGWILHLPAEVPRIDTQHAAHQEEAGLQAQTAVTRPAATSHVVEGGDSLSGVALQETGDASNWHVLFEASRGAQPDGLPRITDPDRIFPGQRITIPAATAPHDNPGDASGQQDQDRPSESETQRPSAGTGSERGDQDTTDDKDHGSDAAGTNASPPATPAPERSEHPSSSARPGQAERPASPSASARPSATARPSASATSAPPASTPGQESSPATQGSAERDSSSVVSTRTAVGAFALLAAGLTGTLALRRLRQRRSRKPGQSLPETGPAPVEAELEEAAGDGSAGVLRLQAALSALAHHSNGTPPQLRAARIAADGVQVLPADVAAEPLAPFTASRAGWWELAGTDDLSVSGDGSAPAAPYPALVTLGADPQGDLVLANLPAFQVLLVDGEPADRAEVIACLATELAIGPFAEHVEVVACGMGSMGADLAALGVQYLPDPRLAATEFAGRLLEAHQEPEGSALPYVMLCCASSMDDDVAWQFAETLDKARGLVPAVLVMPATASAMFPDAETIDATSSEPQRIDTIGCNVVLQRLDAGSIAELANAYRHSDELPVDPDGVWEHVPPETIPLPDPAPPFAAVPEPIQDVGDDADPRLAHEEQAATSVGFQALLGAAADPGQAPLRAVQAPPASEESDASGAQPERIGPRFRIPPSHTILTPDRVAALPETDEDKALSEAGPDDTAPRLRILGGLRMEHAVLEPRLIELAAHLLLRPGSSADVLCEDLGARDPWSTSTLNSRLRALRTRLGTDPDGVLYVPQRVSKASPYALSDKVRCDWSEFERLAKLGVSRGEGGLRYLERALALAGGVPLGEHASSWMVPLRTYMQDQIADVAGTVATYRTLEGPHQDFPSARQACSIGLSADSLSEILHRAMMKIEAEAGNRTGLRTAVAHWQDATRHLSEVDAKTQALVDKLLSA